MPRTPGSWEIELNSIRDENNSLRQECQELRAAVKEYEDFMEKIGALLHSLIQFIISVMLWPLSFWHPTFTVGKWTGP